jgi:hypothetical protein
LIAELFLSNRENNKPKKQQFLISTIHWPPARRAHASERITMLFASILLVSPMEYRRSALLRMSAANELGQSHKQFFEMQPIYQVLFVRKIALSYPSIILGIIICNQPDGHMI